MTMTREPKSSPGPAAELERLAPSQYRFVLHG
jgi:hypothetical protein